MNANHFRGILKIKGYTMPKLAKILGLSNYQINYKVRQSSFTIKEIFIILETVELKFEDVFIIEEQVKKVDKI